MNSKTQLKQKVVDAYNAANGSWVGCDWTTTYPLPDGEEAVVGAGDRDRAERMGVADQYDDYYAAVETDATGAQTFGEAGWAAFERGDYEEAADCFRDAATTEREYGDDPTWGPVARASRALADACPNATAESAYAAGYTEAETMLDEDQPELDKLGGYRNDDWDSGIYECGHDQVVATLGWDSENEEARFGAEFNKGANAAVEDYRKANWPTFEEFYAEIHRVDHDLAPGSETSILGWFNDAYYDALAGHLVTDYAPADLVEYWRAAYEQWEDFDGDDIRDFFDDVAFSL